MATSGGRSPMQNIEDYIAQQLERQEKAIINALDYVGIECINKARDGGAYHDVTGNLRSSIGYIIVNEGVIVSESSFEQIKEGSAGVTEGRAFIQELVAKFPHGIVLIVVAGMKYASYVEAMNKDVLTSAELLAKKRVPALLKQLGLK